MTDPIDEDAVAAKIARWLKWRSGVYLYCSVHREPIPRHHRASASGWREAGMTVAAQEILEGKWREEPEGGWE